MRRTNVLRLVQAVAGCLMVALLHLPVEAQPKPVPVPGTAQPGLRVPPPPKPKPAMLIVLEENQSQSTSVTWARVSQALVDMDWEDVVPREIRDVVKPLIDAAKPVAEALGLPIARLVDEINKAARREAFKMMASVVGGVGGSLGIPGSSCGRGILDTLATQSTQGSKDPFQVAKDQGEEQLGGCLKQMAEPYYDRVVLLTDKNATFANFKEQLRSLTSEGYLIDVLLDVHGCGDPNGNASPLNNVACGVPRLVFTNGDAKVEQMQGLQTLMAPLAKPPVTSFPRQRPAQTEQIPQLGPPVLKPRLNAVYSTACWSADFNPHWLLAGAKAANSPRELNYYVLLSPIVFVDQFTRGGKTLRDAAQAAYNAEKTLLNGKTYTATLNLRPALDTLFPPPTVGIDAIAAACPGGKRSGCKWGFTLGTGYGGLVNKLLANVYGHRKDKPVSTAASSERIHQGDTSLRRAGQ